MSKLKAAEGLAELENSKYKSAARCFTDVSFEIDTHFKEVPSSLFCLLVEIKFQGFAANLS